MHLFCDNLMLLFVIIKTNIAFYVSVSGDEPADDESSLTYAAVVPKQRTTKGLLDLTLLTWCEENQKSITDH